MRVTCTYCGLLHTSTLHQSCRRCRTTIRLRAKWKREKDMGRFVGEFLWQAIFGVRT